jgi:hypothetical protein
MLDEPPRPSVVDGVENPRMSASRTQFTSPCRCIPAHRHRARAPDKTMAFSFGWKQDSDEIGYVSTL